MEWIINNWSLIITVVAVVVYFLLNGKRSVVEFLLQAVVMAEKDLGSGTGKIKLSVVYGNFIEKYNYSDADFMTLYQCVDNRLKNKMYFGMTIDEIVFKEGQFIASYDTNPVQDYYFNLAMKSERLKNDREMQGLPEPVGSDYVYTIYTQHGIYLANDPNAPAYTWWRYSE